MRALSLLRRAFAWFFVSPVRPSKLPITIVLVVVIMSCADQVAVPVTILPALSNIEIGVSYSPEQIRKATGLPDEKAFPQIVGMHFNLIRLSAYWSLIQTRQACDSKISCYDFRQLDYEMGYARDHGQAVMLTVGMKGMGWPEYYIPSFLLHPVPPDGKTVDANQDIADGAISFIKEVVERYHGYQNLIAWQVENEPLDSTGPHNWSISPSFLAEEVGVVKGADSRPVSVNAFSHHFIDPRNFLGGLDHELESLRALNRGDILGLDVYKTPDTRFLGHPFGGLLPDWPNQVGRWQTVATAQGKSAWINEVQAEPWNASTFTPADLIDEIHQLTMPPDEKHPFRFDHLMLWGAEYWLTHPEWMTVIKAIQTFVNQPQIFVAKATAAATL